MLRSGSVERWGVSSEASSGGLASQPYSNKGTIVSKARRSFNLHERLQEQQAVTRCMLRRFELLGFDRTVEHLLDHFAPGEVQALLTYHADRIGQELR